MPHIIDTDYLDEDPAVPNQAYYLLSYLLPSETEEGFPMIKVRGSFRDQEAAEKRVKFLEEKEKYFNIILGEVGKWSPLLTKEQLEKRGDVEVQYREEMMQNLMKSYKESQDKNNIEFEKRTRELREKAIYEGTPEGQLELASRKEEPVSIMNRIEDVGATISDLEKKISELKVKQEEDKARLSSDYTPEEIEDSKKRFEEFLIKQKQNP